MPRTVHNRRNPPSVDIKCFVRADMSVVHFGSSAATRPRAFVLRHGGPRSKAWIVAVSLEGADEVVFDVTFPDGYPERPPCARLSTGGAFAYCPVTTPSSFSAFVERAAQEYTAFVKNAL